jgi:hypothetical protein
MKTYGIRFRADMQEAIRDGRKTETRRTNQSWLKVKKGDRLRVLQSGGLILEATEDARVEALGAMTPRDAMAEGHPRRAGISDEQVHEDAATDWFRDLWDSINGDKPGFSFADNPEVVVLTFRHLEEAS